MKKKVLSLLLAGTVLFSAAPFASATDTIDINKATSVNSGWTLSGSYVPRMVRIVGQTPEWALRLTDTSEDALGFALRDQAISVNAGIDVTFWESHWGGSQADGIAFFIKKADDTTDIPGPVGGSLGYIANGQEPGLSGALLGVGLDTFGGFSQLGPDSSCPNVMGHSRPSSRNAITVHGPGQGSTGYCLMSEPWDTVAHSARGYVDATSRADGARKIRVVVDSVEATNPRVKIYYEDVLAQDLPLPAEFNNVPSVKIGFVGASGGSTNNHEVWGLTTSVANPELVPATTGLANTGADSRILWALVLGAMLLVSLGVTLVNRVR